jgi:hypothetical protein
MFESARLLFLQQRQRFFGLLHRRPVIAAIVKFLRLIEQTFDFCGIGLGYTRLGQKIPSLKNLYTQQLDNFSLVEADHRLPVNNCYRRALKAEIDQFFQRRLVCANVFLHELNTLLR